MVLFKDRKESLLYANHRTANLPSVRRNHLGAAHGTALAPMRLKMVRLFS